MSDVRDLSPDVPEALLDRFTVADAAERTRLIQRLLDTGVPVTLQLPDDPRGAVSARLHSLDAGAGRVALRVLEDGVRAARFDAAPRVYGRAVLDGAELRFELGPAHLAMGDDGRVLQAPTPRRLAWVQRRDAFRIAPPPTVTPRLFVPVSDGPREARILDVSATGVAFEWPGSEPAPGIGTHLPGCRLELPSTTPIGCSLAVRSSTPRPGASTRLGSEFVVIDPAAARAVQVFVNLAQTRARRSRPRVD